MANNIITNVIVPNMFNAMNMANVIIAKIVFAKLRYAKISRKYFWENVKFENMFSKCENFANCLMSPSRS